RLVASRRAGLLARFATLSPRERQVMALVTIGKLNKQVGGDLGLSEITVKAHRGAVMRKMNAGSLADLVRMADVLGEDLASTAKSARPVPTRIAAGVDHHIGYSLGRRTPPSFRAEELYRAR